MNRSGCHASETLHGIQEPMSVQFQLPYGLNQTNTYQYKFGSSEYTLLWNGLTPSVQTTAQQPVPPKHLTDVLQVNQQILSRIFLVHLRQQFRTFSYRYSPTVDLNRVSLFDTELANTLSTGGDIQEKVSTWLEEIAGIDLAARYLPPAGQLRVEARWGTLRTPLSADGLGVNRLVTILTHLAMPEVKLLLVEEPEADLHPKLVSAVMKILLRILREEGKQMLMSTHSEHVVLPLLAGVANGTIDRTSFAVYYVHKERLLTKVDPLTVDDKGQIEGGLEGFFDVDWQIMDEYLKGLAKGSD